jgi:tRNA threonylcarbamoyl adenosine modification protein (Sua5/YciO/YrdC/YwlC family)
VAAARRGALIVLPTDTVYGIGTRPDDPVATARLFAAKDRPPELTLPILSATVDEARKVAMFDERAVRLADACWPGALTIVLPRRDLAAGWDLGGDPATVGVRVPAHELTRAVLRGTGPLAVTSANRSGDRPARTCDELVAAFEDLVAVYLCQDEPLGGAASTVIDLAHGDARILRRGDLDETDLARFMGAQDPLLDSGPS